MGKVGYGMITDGTGVCGAFGGLGAATVEDVGAGDGGSGISGAGKVPDGMDICGAL